jgi:hypothetical protein
MAEELQLVGEQRLRVDHAAGGSILSLIGREGRVSLTVRVTPDGPVLEFAGAGLRLLTDGNLDVAARNIRLVAAEDLQLVSGGDLSVAACGELTTTAAGQEIVATRGDVQVRANDDVRMNGERVMMNCD